MSTQKSEFLTAYTTTEDLSVLWGDMDAFGHINNTVYFRYFEIVRMKYFEKTGVNAHKIATQVGPILANTQCQFRAPLTYPENIIIGTRIKDAANIKEDEKRFTMEYAVFSEQQDCIAAKGEGTIVYYDYKLGKSCPIPIAILDSFNSI
jgi:acyl-CoA thioester hydrolase